MQSFDSWRPVLEDQACPTCGVGRLLGPWPASPRFDQTPGLGPVRFRVFEEETAQRD
jgi:hypothetical protein